MKKLIGLIILWIIVFPARSQGSLSLYPLYNSVLKTNQMNPALKPAGKLFISVPLLSGIRMRLRTDWSLEDVITRSKDDSLHINLDKILSGNREKKKLLFDAGLNIIQAGYTGKIGSIFFTASLNSYHELVFSNDFLALLIKGNGSSDVLGKYIDLNQQGQNSYVFGMMGIGYSREIIPGKVTAGIRLSVLSGAFCFSLDSRNAGYIYSDPESYHITIDAKNLRYNISGYDKYLGGKFNPWSVFDFKNTGLSAGFGVQWQLNDHWRFSASVNDLGSLKWRDDVTNYSVNDRSFVYSGIRLDDIEGVQSVLDSLRNTFEPETSHRNFSTRLHPRSYLCANYLLTSNNSFVLLSRNTYRRNGSVNVSGLGYYQKFGNWLEMSTGFYLYDFHYCMLGLGLSGRFNRLGLYLATDNLIGLFNLSKTHTADFSFGMNINFLSSLPGN